VPKRVCDFLPVGLLLTPYFYESLAAYEAGDNPFRDEIGPMAAAMTREGAGTFENTFSSIPLAQKQPVRAEAPVAPPVDPVLELLRTAQAAFRTG
jgi:hypothetical protein